eukprot:237992-Amphidinium_carterae.1
MASGDFEPLDKSCLRLAFRSARFFAFSVLQETAGSSLSTERGISSSTTRVERGLLVLENTFPSLERGHWPCTIV